MYCCYLSYCIRFLFFTVGLLYVNVRMNRYLMFLLRQRRLNKLIIIYIYIYIYIYRKARAHTHVNRHMPAHTHAHARTRTRTHTHHTSYPYLVYVTRPTSRPLFRHAIQDTCRDTSRMLSAHAQRLLFGRARIVKECFPSRTITTRHALYNETFAKVLQQSGSV